MANNHKGFFRSPIGLIAVESDGEAITGINFCEEGALEHDSREESVLPVIQKCIQELDEYFKGSRRSFDVPLSLKGTEFQKKVWKCLLTIPYGKSLSYQEIALGIDNSKACRAVGAAIGKNPACLLIPCHRVIGKDGSLTGFAWGTDRKKLLLEHEKEKKA